MVEIQEGKFETYLGIQQKSDYTIKQYVQRERWFIKHFMKNKDDTFKELNQAVVDDYIGNWLRKHQNPFNAGFIKSYIKCYQSEEHRFILPETLIKKRDVSAKKYKYLEQNELFKLIDSMFKIDNRKLYTIGLCCIIMSETGLRLTECLNIRKQKRTGIKEPNWSFNLHTRHITGIGKKNKYFRVHFSKKCAKIILWYLKKYKIDLSLNEEVYLFKLIKPNGDEYKNQQYEFWKVMKDTSNKILKKHAHPHMLRHSLGHLLRTEKFDLPTIQKILRHSSITSTAIYTEVSEEEVEERMDKEIFKES